MSAVSPPSCGSVIPQAKRAAVAVWMPLFDSGNVAENVVALFVNALGVPAPTLERPRGARRYGTVRGWSSGESPACGVATMSPRTVTTPPGPIVKVSTLGKAANAEAGTERLTVTGVLEPAGTVTLDGDTATLAPRWFPFGTTARS